MMDSFLDPDSDLDEKDLVKTESSEWVNTNSESANSSSSAPSESASELPPELPPELADLYRWIDTIPFNKRTKKNIARDFSDASMCAEMLHHFFPGMVEMHNYPVISNTHRKEISWAVLNRKVLRKLGCTVDQPLIHEISTNVNGAIEKFLLRLKPVIESKVCQERVRRAVSCSMAKVDVGNLTGTPKIPRCNQSAHARLTGGNQHPSEEPDKKKGRENEIRTLRNKVGQMEKLLKQRDERVVELTKQLERFKKVTINKPGARRPSTSPAFKKI